MQMKWLGHYWCKVGATLRAQLNHTSVWSSKFPKFFLNGNLKKNYWHGALFLRTMTLMVFTSVAEMLIWQTI